MKKLNQKRYFVKMFRAYCIINAVTPTGRTAKINKTEMVVYGFRDVPTSKVDILLPKKIESLFRHEYILFDVIEKHGKYDGKKRVRFTMRSAYSAVISETNDISMCVKNNTRIITIDDEVFEFPIIKKDVNNYHLARIAMWHWRRYFTHLTDEDNVREICDTWAETEATEMAEEGATIVELNRAADRMLYNLSRELGWRKMTLRERLQHGLGVDSPCWQRVGCLYEDNFSATGCGEHTLCESHPNK